MKLNLGIIEHSIGIICEGAVYERGDIVSLNNVLPYTPGCDTSAPDVLYVFLWEQLEQYDGRVKNVVCIGGGEAAARFFAEHKTYGLIVGDNIDILELIRKISEVFYYYNSLEAKLIKSILTQASTRTILSNCADFFEAHVMLFGFDYSLLDYSDNYLPPESDPVWSETLTKKQCAIQMNPKKQMKIQPNIPKSYPKSDFTEIEGLSPYFVIGLDYGDSRFASLIIMQSQSQLHLSQQWIVDSISELINPIIAKRYNSSVGIRNRLRATISAMLYQQKKEPSLIYTDFKKNDWKTHDTYRIMVVFLPTMGHQSSHYLYRYENIFAEKYQDCIATSYEGYIVLALHERATELTPPIIELLTKQLELDNGKCSIGVRFCDYNYIPYHHKLVLSMLRQNDENNRILYCKKALPVHIATELNAIIPLRALCSSVAISIYEYDRAKDTNLLYTLETYLLCNKSLTAAANKLFIHKSTLSYRLKCVEKIAPIDYNDPDERFEILLSCIALRALNDKKNDLSWVSDPKEPE